MARLESVAVGGYYPTPERVVPMIASLLRVEPTSLVATRNPEYGYVDPCAGDGAAILSLIQALHGSDKDSLLSCGNLYAIEMEEGRHAALVERINEGGYPWKWRNDALHGDAFKAHWELGTGASLLWLNPPYDFDPRYKRLEERFLVRYAPILGPGGILVFLIPFQALAASAVTLTRYFDRVECFRFPDPEFEVFKQIVVIARRRSEDELFEPDLFKPDAAMVEQIQGLELATLPVLPTAMAQPFHLPQVESYRHALNEWKLVDFDYKSLLDEVRPWTMSDRAGRSQRVPGIVPEGDVEDFLVRTFPVAMPPRSAHIAAGIAAGIFNGARIEPDNTRSKLPPLLVKGVFDREYKTVEEKTDKEGNVKALVQVQQPKLVTTVLDLHSGTYTTITPSAERTHAKDIPSMTMADLLGEYGQGLMRVMLRQCPVLHDPARPEDNIELPELSRPLFKAQAHATQATIKLLGGLDVAPHRRRRRSAFVLGEIGSGKTSVALTVAKAIKSKRTLVMCPPHLLDSWIEQIDLVTPEVDRVVLSDVGDVEALAKRQSDRPLIAILSRETAKLGHGVAGLDGLCPKCGMPVEPGVNHAKKRSRCETRLIRKVGRVGELIEQLAIGLLSVFPRDSWLDQILWQRPFQARIERLKASKPDRDEAWAKVVASGLVQRVARELVKVSNANISIVDNENALKAIQALVASCPEPELIADVATALYQRGLGSQEVQYYYHREGFIKTALEMLLLVDHPLVADTADTLKALWPEKSYSNPWNRWDEERNILWRGKTSSSHYYGTAPQRDEDGNLTWGGKDKQVAHPRRALEAIGALAPIGLVRDEKPCGEPLFQAVPEPRRYPLATFIARRYPALFDFLVLDEGHEYASGDSAQSHAAHRLTALGIPTILMTGTVMNGYAESMFTNAWALSEAFRLEFPQRGEKMPFVNRYGYRKRIVEDKDKDSGEVVAFGSMTDRVERSERFVGKAPGVLPLFLFKHLLPISVTLHKVDLAADIPNCHEEVVSIEPSKAQKSEYKRMEAALLRQIQKDRFQPDLSGKLWGALAHFPSYLDLASADTGNTDDNEFVIKYPDSVESGRVIAAADPIDPDTILPKEAWMLDQIEASLAEGRNVLVFAWHTVLQARLARLIAKRLGTKCPILDPAKVSTKKRQAWIDREVVKRKHRVLVVNPVTIQTGLNNLVYFSDEIWMENPACNPTIYRQAVGRVDRVGQTEETRIFFPLYEDTAQTALHSLLMHKVAVSMSTDGLDAESALQAAGIGEDTGFSSFAVGRQLYEMLMQREAA